MEVEGKYFIGPTLGESIEPIIYCLDSDESSMIQPETQLSERARKSDLEYMQNNTAFMLSVLASTKPTDHLILDQKHLDTPELLKYTYGIYEKLSLTPTKNIHYAKQKNFANTAKNLQKELGIKTISSIGYSYLLAETFPIQERLAISKYVNAKTSLLPLSQKYNFSIPDSLLINLSEITPEKLDSLRFPSDPIYVKTDGLGGGYNVTKVKTVPQLQEILVELSHPCTKALVQAAVPKGFLETEHIFTIYPDRTEHLYSAVQITQNSSWYGNVFLANPTLSSAQKKSLSNTTYALQQEGYADDKGLLVGFDSLSNGEEMYITEFNARWLGSLPIKLLLERLGLLNTERVFSTFDYIADPEVTKYMCFAEKNLYGCSTSPNFSMIPVSYSAYSTDSKRVVCFVVTGDLIAFQEAVRRNFSEDSFIMLNNSIDFIVKKQLLSQEE